MSLFEMLHDRLREEELLLVACMCWLIWMRHNLIVFGGEFKSPSTLYRSAKEQLDAFNKVEFDWRDKAFKPRAIHVTTWQRLEHGYLKANWDAALDRNGRRMGVGLIVHDHKGRVVVALYAPRLYVHDHTTAEALAAWHLAEFCMQLGYKKIILEGDSLEIVQAFHKESSCNKRYGHLEDDVKVLLDSTPSG
jgi:hypothetical protein